jgi:D-3-phosphoglycerate dehydrogenase / 2-oxoglutarate reductase
VNIAVGSSSFAARDSAPMDLLEAAGLDVSPNPFGRRLTEDETIELLQDKVGLIAGLEPLTRRVFEASPTLRAIARVGIGMDSVDQGAAVDFGIKVSNTPDEPAEAVAELTVTALLAMMREFVRANSNLHRGRWEKVFGRSLSGNTVALVGFGRIGRQVGELLRPFRPRILVVDPLIDQNTAPDWVEMSTLTEALAEADAVSLHASGTEVLLGENELAGMKAGALLLNAARGQLIDEAALVEALRTGHLGGVWLDVFWNEPYQGELIGMDGVLLSPHIGTYTRECRLQMERAAACNLLRDLGLG